MQLKAYGTYYHFFIVLVIRNVCTSTIVLLLDVSYVTISAIILSITILIKHMYI